MNRSSVDSLFRLAESHEVLDHRRDIETLETLDVAIAHLSCKVWIFGEGFFDPTISQLTSQVHDRSKELGDTKCTSFLGDVFGHLLDQL
jgi:hypothetical protein